MANSPYGMVLVSGPTGSGKTTTLYAVMRTINAMKKTFSPSKTRWNTRCRWSSRLKSTKRRALPSPARYAAFCARTRTSCLIGEVRDEETAGLGMRAALTGHLVFSTVHTNDAIGVVVRLRDLGGGELPLSRRPSAGWFPSACFACCAHTARRSSSREEALARYRAGTNFRARRLPPLQADRVHRGAPRSRRFCT